ncbi:MAG: serine/threonine-protein kinase [Pseudomonadota bacterium]
MSEQRATSKPTQIGKYRIDKVVGAGAMGIVYRAFDPSIERTVAIKTIRGELLSSEDGDNWRERFLREVRVAARCLHPNLVTVFGCGEDNGIPYIVMEFVAGRPLHEYKGAEGFGTDTAVYVISQVLRALEVAHQSGIVHRDIKPANVMLLDNAMVKVTDFGIAKLESSQLTAHGSMVGTPSYMSPEQFMGAEVDQRSDLFSTGVVLYELIAGQRPFLGKSNAELLYRVANEMPADPRLLNPQISAPLAGVVMRALAKRPEERFQSARAFAEALAATESDPAAATIIAMPHTAAAPVPVMPQSAAAFDAEAMERLERELTKIIGPIAKVVLKRAAKEATNEEDLRAALIEAVGEGAMAEAFRRVLHRTTLTSVHSYASRPADGQGQNQPRLMLPPEVITSTQRSLASFVGPMARVLIDRAAMSARDHEEFYRTLAESIPSDRDRNDFLRKHL